MDESRQYILEMCNRLANYHWSPKHPSQYVLPAPDGKTRGVGLIAHNNYGAFNLAWADVEGKCSTVAEQLVIINKFSHYQIHTQYVLCGMPLEDWACLTRPAAFYKLIQDNKHTLPPTLCKILEGVATKAATLEKVSL